MKKVVQQQKPHSEGVSLSWSNSIYPALRRAPQKLSRRRNTLGQRSGYAAKRLRLPAGQVETPIL
jgi:hypothetical protein